MRSPSVIKQKRIDSGVKIASVYGKNCSWVLCFNYSGFSADSFVRIRATLRSIGVGIFVVKNTVNGFALSAAGFLGVSEKLKGPVVTMVVSEQTPSPVIKAVGNFLKSGSLSLLACSNRSNLYDSASIDFLLSLPNLEEARSMLIGTLSSPAQNLYSVLQQPSSLLSVLQERAEMLK